MHYQVRPRGSGRPLISVILIDWGVRESFHSLTYLNRQTFPRDSTELIWVEFYDRRPAELRDAIENPASRMAIDTWIVLDRSADTYYHKHEMYNAGVIAASGEICIICDSDAMFAETFLDSVYLAFRRARGLVVHVDQVRSEDPRFYPFNGPSVEDVMAAPGLINWTGVTTTGLADSSDTLHTRNYGACMCARRQDLIEIGGVDEHLDYLGYICGPHEMTFRLVNAGRRERWLEHEWIYHTWHPGQAGEKNFGGPHDGRNFSLRTLDLIQNRRVEPWVENPVIAALRRSDPRDRSDLLAELAARDCTPWTDPERYLDAINPVFLVEENVDGCNIVRSGDLFVALAQPEGVYIRERLFERAYTTAYVASNLEDVKRAIREGPGSRFHLSRAVLPEAKPPRGSVPSVVAPCASEISSPAAAADRAFGALLVAPSTRGCATALARPRALVRSRLATEYARALYDAGDSRRALAVFQVAVESDPENRTARMGLANARVAEGRPQGALADFEELLAVIPASHTMERCEALVGRAWVKYHLGRWLEAVEDFSAALPLAEGLSHADLVQNIYQGRAWAQARVGHRQAAIADFMRRSGSAQRPRQGSMWFEYGVFRLRGRLARIRRRARAFRSGRGRATAPAGTPTVP